MIYSILLVFEKPDLSNVENRRQWEYCKTKIAGISMQNKEIQVLAENVLLISLQKSLTGISCVAQSLEGLSYKYIILPEDVEWREQPKKG
jgi:hypothetical protein